VWVFGGGLGVGCAGVCGGGGVCLWGGFFLGGGGDLCLSAEKDGQLRAWAWLGMENAMHRLAKGGSVSCIGLAKVELGDGAQAWRGGCKSRTAY